MQHHDTCPSHTDFSPGTNQGGRVFASSSSKHLPRPEGSFGTWPGDGRRGAYIAGAAVPTFRGLQPDQAGLAQPQAPSLGARVRWEGCQGPSIPRPFCAPQGVAVPIELNVNGPPEFLRGHSIHATHTPPPRPTSAPWKRGSTIKKKKTKQLCLCDPGMVKTLNGKHMKRKASGPLEPWGSQSCPLWPSTTSCYVTLGNILSLFRSELFHLRKRYYTQ